MSALDVLDLVNEYLWTIALIAIVIMGVASTILLRGVQFRSFRTMWRCTFGDRKEKDSDTMSSFQVFCMSMGSRIGVGNISGPILAILVGGPGAIFWMWVFGLMGMATSFLETTIGQIYKVKASDGGYRGGMAYGVTKGLGNKRIGLLVAFIMVLMYIVGYVSMEVCTMTGAIVGAVGNEAVKPVFAVIFTIVCGLILMGGIRRVADLSTKIVPPMAILWIVFCIIAIVMHGDGIAAAISSIFNYAFSLPACIGGGLGAIIMNGMKRGVLSNEAGVGTIPNLSSMSHVKHPVSQGMSQALGVFIDLWICTMGALVILSFADIETLVNLDMESMGLLQHVLEGSFGSIAPFLVAFFVFLFAFTCLISDYVIGENNLSLIKDSPKVEVGLKLFLLAVIFISAMLASDQMYAVVDFCLALCAFVNTYYMVRLGGRALEAYKDYKRQREEGVEDPVFEKSCLSDQTGVTEWD